MTFGYVLAMERIYNPAKDARLTSTITRPKPQKQKNKMSQRIIKNNAITTIADASEMRKIPRSVGR